MNETASRCSERLNLIQASIRSAAQRSGRSENDVKLMAVTKTKPEEVIRSLIEIGVRYFGENYPDETLRKLSAFESAPSETRLCMIGHLQSRKAKIILDYFDEFHSLDSLKTAERISRGLDERGKSMRALLEINIGGETSKHGWNAAESTDRLYRDLDSILRLPGLTLAGLMTLPPYAADAESNRVYFARMRELAERIDRQFGLSLRELSMGTSDDFEVAIEEGATIVRIGTKLVGAREKVGEIQGG